MKVAKKKKNKVDNSYFDARTDSMVTDAHIEENDKGWKIVKNQTINPPIAKTYTNQSNLKNTTNSNANNTMLTQTVGQPTNINTMSAAPTNNIADNLVKKLSKKTGYTEEEVTNFINDYNNGKWDNTNPKYRVAGDKFSSAGTEVYKAAKEYDKYRATEKKLGKLENVAQSSVNAVVETGKGVLDFAEGTSDTLLQMGSSKYNPGMWIATGQTPWSKDQSKLNEYQNIAKEIIGADSSEKALDVLGYNKVLSDGRTVQQTLDSRALINSKNLGGKVFRSIGAQLPGLMTGSETQSLGLMGVSSFGSGVEEAYNSGATRGQATGYGLLNSAIEVGTEKMFAGVGGVIGKGEIDDAIIKGINKKIKSEIGQKLVSFGIKSLGEGTEELIGDLLQPLAKKLTYASEEDLKKLYSNQNYLEDFVLGSLSAAIMQGSTMPINNANQNAIKDSLKGKVTTQNATEIYEQIKDQNEELADWEVANIVNNALQETNQSTIDFNKSKINENLPANSNIEQQNTLDNINNTIEQNSSEKLSKKEIKVIAEEVSNQQEKKLNQTVEMPKSELKQYENITDAVNDYANKVKSDFKTNIEIKTNKKIAPVDYKSQSQATIFQKAKSVFSKIGKSVFKNNGENIYVSNGDIKESIAKTVRNEQQKQLLSEHMEIFSNLDKIIENGELIAKGNETKGRSQFNNWDYYATPVKIDGENYIVEFDTVVRDNKQKHFRLERIYSLNDFTKKQAVPTDKIDKQSVNRFVEQPVSDNNDTTKSTKSQVAPISSQYSMQQNEKNDTKKVKPPIVREQNTIDEKIKKSEKVVKVSEMSDKQLKDASKTIAERINKNGGLEMKQRSWVKTSTESEILDGAVSINDLDPEKVYYTPTSNKTTLEEANSELDKKGYDGAIEYIKNKMSSDERVKASDVALAERLIQEAVAKGDMKTAQELIMDAAILGTEYGQTIQALSIIQRLTPEGQLKMLEKIVSREKSKGNKTFEGVEITPEMVEKVLKAYNENGTYDQDDLNRRVEEVKQEIADQLKTTFGEKVDAWRYLSMLGNPKTHIRNIVSNVAMKGAIEYKNAIARTIETVIPIKNRTKTWKKSSDQVKSFAKQKATELRDVISGETKYSEKTSIEAKKTIFKTKFLEGLYNTNSNLLDLEDWLFSKSAFERTFREYLTAQGIETETDIKNNPKIIEEAQNYAVEQAQIATFRQYSKLASEINRIERTNKAAGLAIKATIPFKKTPINIAKAGVNYSPLGLIKNLSYDIVQVTKGNMEASQYIDNLSQGLSGTTLTVLGYILAKAGILKGDDDNDKKSKYDSALGNKAYTIKLGNNYYSLSWLSPVGMPLFVGANAYKQLEESKDVDMNVITDMLVSTVNPISEMSLVSSLTDTLKSYSANGSASIQSMGEKAIKSYVGQYFPTFLSQIASVADSEKRSTSASSNSKWKYGEEVLNSIKYKIPGLRQTLPAYTDSWGNTQKQADNIFIRAWENFIAPYTRYENKTTKLDKEIMRVYYETGSADVIPGTPNSYIRYKNEQYKFSNKEYQKFRKTYGTTANNYLNALVKNERYKSAKDEDKAKMIDKIYDYALAAAQSEYFGGKKIDFDKSEAKKIDRFKSLDYSYSDIAEEIISNYYKYKRTK